jgi:hypothetical protein
MLAYVINEGRLLGLGPIEWSMLVAGSTLGGLFTLIF